MSDAWIETGAAPVCAACGVAVGEHHRGDCVILWGGTPRPNPSPPEGAPDPMLEEFIRLNAAWLSQQAANRSLWAALGYIVDHYDMRSEIYTNDADLAGGMVAIARQALRGEAARPASPSPPEPSAGWRIGQQVAVQPTYIYAADWRDATLFICGIDAKPVTGEVLLSVSEHWPPTGLGDITTDFRESDLGPCALTAPSEPAKPASGPVGELEEHKALSPLVGQGNEGSSRTNSGGSPPLRAAKSDSQEGH